MLEQRSGGGGGGGDGDDECDDEVGGLVGGEVGGNVEGTADFHQMVEGLKANLTKSQLKRLKAKQRHSRCRTLRESAKLAKREAELPPVAALPHVAEPSLIVTGQPVGQPHELRLALQQERQARIAAEVWCETLNLARIAEMRERAYQMAPPFVVTPKLGAVHLVMLPSRLILAAPAMYHMDACRHVADEIARRFTTAKEVCDSPTYPNTTHTCFIAHRIYSRLSIAVDSCR